MRSPATRPRRKSVSPKRSMVYDARLIRERGLGHLVAGSVLPSREDPIEGRLGLLRQPCPAVRGALTKQGEAPCNFSCNAASKRSASFPSFH